MQWTSKHDAAIEVKQNEFPSQLLLSAERVAELLDISTRTLWRLRAAGKLPAPVRLGGSVRWQFETIQTWIEAGCPES